MTPAGLFVVADADNPAHVFTAEPVTTWDGARAMLAAARAIYPDHAWKIVPKGGKHAR